jgi:alpha-L-fucosidase 2
MKILPFVAIAFFGATSISSASDLVLWYRQPAVVTRTSPLINEALPIGNGHFGGLIAGGTAREQVVLDEDSLWLGGDNPSGNDNTMGSYQMLGSLFINLPGHENATDYRRHLDIGDALAHVSYSVNGVKYFREYFCSHADGVLVMRLIAIYSVINNCALSCVVLQWGHEATED